MTLKQHLMSAVVWSGTLDELVAGVADRTLFALEVADFAGAKGLH